MSIKFTPLKFSDLQVSYQSAIAPLIISIIAFICWLFPTSIEPIWIYDKQAIGNGEVWRLFTAHLLHTNGYHLLLNMAGLWLLWLLHANFYHTKHYVVLFVFCSLSVGLCLFYFSTLSYYVGLSGVLHSLFAWGACKDIEKKDNTGYLLIIGLIAKLVHEQMVGASEELAKLIDANVATDAHLYGAMAGIVFFLMSKVFKKFI